MFKKCFLFICIFSIYLQGTFVLSTGFIPTDVELDKDCTIWTRESKKSNHLRHPPIPYISKTLQERHPDPTETDITGFNENRGEGLPYNDSFLNEQDDRSTMEVSDVKLDEDCLMRPEELEKPNHITTLYISKYLQSRYPDDSTKINMTGINRNRGEGLPYQDFVLDKQNDRSTMEVSDVELDEDWLMRPEELKLNHTPIPYISKYLQSRYPEDPIKINMTGVNRNRGEGLPYEDIVLNNQPSIDKSSKTKSREKLCLDYPSSNFNLSKINKNYLKEAYKTCPFKPSLKHKRKICVDFEFHRSFYEMWSEINFLSS